MKLSLKRKEVEVVLEGERGEDRRFLILELTGKERDTYTGIIASKMRFDANGKPAGMRDFSGLQVALLELCLHEGGNRVKRAEIEGWPSSTVSALFSEAQRISALSGPEAEDVGNG